MYYRSILLLAIAVALTFCAFSGLFPYTTKDDKALVNLMIVVAFGGAAIVAIFEFMLATFERQAMAHRRDRALRYLSHEAMTGRKPVGTIGKFDCGND